MSMARKHRLALSKQAHVVGLQMLSMVQWCWRLSGTKAQHLPECQGDISFFSVPAEKLTVVPVSSFGNGGISKGFDTRHARHLLEDFGVVALLGAVPVEVVDAVRNVVLQIPKSEELGGLQGPENRRQTLLSLSDASVETLVRHAIQVVRPLIAPMLGFDATLVELAAITARSGALPQNAHTDTLPAEASQQLSQLMQVQVMLQDTDKHMGPLNVLPRSQRCTPRPYSDCLGDFVVDAVAARCSEANYSQAVTPLPAIAGSVVLYNSRTLHFGGQHTRGPDRVTAVFSFMQGLSANLPPARGSTFSLDPALWGRYTLSSLPEPCTNRSIPKWQYEQFESPLHACAKLFGNASLASQLLDETISSKGQNAMRSALAMATNESYDMLVTPLDVAAINGHVDVAEVFISYRAELTASPDGCGPLHHAAMNGHNAVLKLLLARRADVEAPSNYGEALHVAAIWGRSVPVVKTLLRAYTKIENEDGSARGLVDALAKAATAGHVPVVRSLIKHGISMHDVDSKGIPILFSAAGAGHLPVVKFFVNHGADISDDLSELASSLGHDHVAQFIGAKIQATNVGLRQAEL